MLHGDVPDHRCLAGFFHGTTALKPWSVSFTVFSANYSYAGWSWCAARRSADAWNALHFALMQAKASTLHIENENGHKYISFLLPNSSRTKMTKGLEAENHEVKLIFNLQIKYKSAFYIVVFVYYVQAFCLNVTFESTRFCKRWTNEEPLDVDDVPSTSKDWIFTSRHHPQWNKVVLFNETGLQPNKLLQILKIASVSSLTAAAFPTVPCGLQRKLADGFHLLQIVSHDATQPAAICEFQQASWLECVRWRKRTGGEPRRCGINGPGVTAGENSATAKMWLQTRDASVSKQPTVGARTYVVLCIFFL